MRKPFGQLSIGDEFSFAGRTFAKLDDFNAQTTVKRGKENFIFFKRDLVKVTSISVACDETGNPVLGNDSTSFLKEMDKVMLDKYIPISDTAEDIYQKLMKITGAEKIYRALTEIEITVRDCDFKDGKRISDDGDYWINFEMKFEDFEGKNKISKNHNTIINSSYLSDWNCNLPEITWIHKKNSLNAKKEKIVFNISFSGGIVEMKSINPDKVFLSEYTDSDFFKRIAEANNIVHLIFNPGKLKYCFDLSDSI